MKIVRLFLILCAISFVNSACKVEDISNTLINSESAKATYITNLSVVESDGTYGPGAVIHIHVEFNEDIVIFSGFPSLTLNSGNVAVFNGSMYNSYTAIFDYPISVGDSSSDLNYIDINSLNINSALVNNVSTGDPASLVLPDPLSGNSIGTNHNVVIDGIAPPAPNVVGVYDGANDTLVDNVLDGGIPTPRIDWIDVSGEAGYNIEVFDHTFTSVCFHSVGADVTTVDMVVAGCNLQMSREHKVVVSSVDAVGNSADSPDFLFMVSPFPTMGMQLWLDADDPNSLDLNIMNVTSWKDKSPMNNDAVQATTAKQPDFNASAFGGMPGIQFDGVDDCLITGPDPAMDNDELSVIFVMNDVYSGGTDRPFNIGYSGGAGGSTPSQMMMTMGLGGGGVDYKPLGRSSGGGAQFVNIFSPSLGSGRQVISMIWTASDQIRNYFNGVSSSSVSGVSANPVGHLSTQIGCRDIGASFFDHYQGYMGEVLIYNRALPDGERSNIESFLMSKWP